MLVKIPCPITGEEIKNPVIYDGYIYDLESLKMHYPQLKELIDNELIHDLFTQDLLKYIQTTRSTKIKLSDLNEIYQCPLLFTFPFNSVLCLKDGKVYDTELHAIQSLSVIKKQFQINQHTFTQ